MAEIYNPLLTPVTIPKYKKHIILDFMGTIAYEDPNWNPYSITIQKSNAHRVHKKIMILRPGIELLMQAYKVDNNKIVIHSDTSVCQIKQMLNGTHKYIDGICAGNQFVFEEQIYNEQNNRIEIRTIKNLEKTCQKYNLNPEETMFFGDTVIDIDSAQRYNMDLVFVPHSEVFPSFNFIDILPESKIKYLESINKIHKNTKYIS